MLDRAPCRWHVLDLVDHAEENHTNLPDGSYVAARPFGFYSWGGRLALAWAVFTGKADAVFWEDQ